MTERSSQFQPAVYKMTKFQTRAEIFPELKLRKIKLKTRYKDKHEHLAYVMNKSDELGRMNAILLF